MIFQIVTWILAVLSIISMELIIKKNRIGFLIGFIANVAWVGVNIYMKIWAQAALLSVFVFMSMRGFILWKTSKEEEKKDV